MDIQIKRIIKLGNLVIPVLKGDKGDKGEQGKQGVTGQDGYTPIRGIDYWNQEDKDAIKQEIYAEIDPKLGNKVDKEQGKGLSTNDFTNILKEKLENLENYNDEEIRKLLNGSLKNVNYTASNGMLTFTKNDGSTISVDLPLELLIESGRYDEANKQIVLTLANGNVINIPISDLLDDFYDKGETYNKTEIDNIIAEKQALIEKLELENKSQQEEIDMLTADYKEGKAEGETAVVSDGLPKSKVKVTVNGNSYQETTEGYQLIDLEDKEQNKNGITATCKNGVITLNGTSTSSEAFNIIFPLSTDITLGENYSFLPIGRDKTKYDYYILNLNYTYQFYNSSLSNVISQTQEYYLTEFYLSIKPGATFNNHIIKPTLVSGTYTESNFPEFEPYTNGVATPNTENPRDIEVITECSIKQTCSETGETKIIPIDLQGNSIAKVGEIADKLNIGVNGSVKIGDKVIKKYVFTGDENMITSSRTDVKRYVAQYILKDKGIINNTRNDILCNYFKTITASQSDSGNLGLAKYNDTGFMFNFPLDTEFSTSELFKTWLKEKYDSGEPLYVDYVLAEPQTIQLPSIEPITLFEGTNVFELITNLGTTLAVTYKVSNKSRLEALENAILSLGGNV